MMYTYFESLSLQLDQACARHNTGSAAVLRARNCPPKTHRGGWFLPHEHTTWALLFCGAIAI